MSITPFLKTINSEGGSFYTFPSAANDVSKSIANDNIEMVFSKYVLLNIPDFERLDFTTFSNYKNSFQLDTQDGAIVNLNQSSNLNRKLIESLQNYSYNIESLILSSTNYNTDTYQTVSERVFFKWLKECGVLRFRNSNNLERSSIQTESRYVEEDENLTGDIRYSRVIQYIGDIDAVNHVSFKGDSFTEVYIYLPTDHGKTPTVLLKAFSDDNYQPGMILKSNSEYINGRSSTSVHPQGLNTFSFFDVDSQIDWTDTNSNWMNDPFPQQNINSYFTEPVTFEDASNTDIRKYPADYGNPPGYLGTAFRRSKLDGISIDFDPSSYQQIDANKFSSIANFNKSSLSSNFEFNAVLVYYDIFDRNSIENKSTNLYGILFLDDIQQTLNGGFIPRERKIKPNPVSGDNGNNLGFKINLRVSPTAFQSGVRNIINEYNNFSTSQFMEAVALLQSNISLFERLSRTVIEIQEDLENLKSISYTQSSLSTLNQRLSNLEKSFNSAGLIRNNDNAVLQLIAKTNKQISSIIEGRTPLELTYDTEAFVNSPFIKWEKSANKIKPVFEQNTYKFQQIKDQNNVIYEIDSDINIEVSNLILTLMIGNYTSMCRLSPINTAVDNIVIRLDDSLSRWKTGQSLKVVFDKELVLNGYSIDIRTDARSSKSNSPYGILVGTINNLDLISTTPIIEIICTDEINYKFKIDILK